MLSLTEYIDSRLNRLIGSFDIYQNKEGKFLHLSKKANIKVDLNFWQYIKTIDKNE